MPRLNSKRTRGGLALRYALSLCVVGCSSNEAGSRDAHQVGDGGTVAAIAGGRAAGSGGTGGGAPSAGAGGVTVAGGSGDNVAGTGLSGGGVAGVSGSGVAGASGGGVAGVSGGGVAGVTMAAGGAAAGASGTAGEATAGGGASGASRGGAGGESTTFALHPVDFPLVDGQLAFPPSAVSPSDQSPAFTWEGTPSDAQSLVFVFRDVGISAIKWVVWDIPPGVDHLPPNVSKDPSPTEIPGASQLGSLMNIGYAGPQRANGQYDFTLYALKVEHLDGTGGLTTKQIFDTLLPPQVIAQTDPIVVVNAQ